MAHLRYLLTLWVAIPFLAFGQVQDDWLPYKADTNVYSLTEVQKNKIAKAYFKLNPGNWMSVACFKVIGELDPGEVKARNNAILSHLKEQHFDTSNIIIRYNKYQHLMIFKPYMRKKATSFDKSGMPDKQIFNLDNSRGGRFYTKLGTQLIFPSFVFPSMGHKIRVEVLEFTSRAYMVKAGITTTDVRNNSVNAKVLLNVRVFEREEELLLKPGAQFEIRTFIDAAVDSNEYYSYYGNANTTNIKWRQNTIQRFKHRVKQVYDPEVLEKETLDESEATLYTHFLKGKFSKMGWVACGSPIKRTVLKKNKLYRTVEGMSERARAYVVSKSTNSVKAMMPVMNGKFYVDDLEPGDYYVVVVEKVNTGYLFNLSKLETERIEKQLLYERISDKEFEIRLKQFLG